MKKFDYDLFVIGGGSGGVRGGRLAASMGKKVGVAEEYRYGGTCVIRGCVPKKLMVYASHFSSEFEAAKGFGWSIGETSFDWKTLIANKDVEIDRLEGIYRSVLGNVDADVFDSRAELRGPHEVYLSARKKTVTAEKILVAVGGTPLRTASVKGDDLCITSDEIFHLEAQPSSIVIAGGGYIAVEFACILAGLGTKVTLIYRGEQILRGFDDDLRYALHDEMKAKGIDIHLGTVFSNISGEKDTSKTVELSDGSVLEVDQVMLAIGRIPQTKNLGLEQAGVETDSRGFIKVDPYSRTNVPSVLAVGDVTNRVSLTPVAIHEAMCLVETEFKDNPVRPDHDLIPTAVFSQPEIGTIGLTETEAAQKHASLNVFRAHFRPMKNTLSGSNQKMLMKVIVDAKSDKVVGLHILGEGAGEAAQTLGIAIKAGATKADFDRTMAVHPTATEELVTMYEPSYQVINGERLTS